ncbi:MAG: holin family protein [Gammaproteobacteria bacterium]|nr:holin family protein [Gammaproteobacteria bacterium]
MSFLSKLMGGGDIVKSVGDALDNLFTSDEERLEAERELTRAKRSFDYKESKLVAEQNIAQMEVNKADANSGNFFQAGWRPAIGWVGAFALAYQFILYPLLVWALAISSLDIEPPPLIDANALYPIITGMLGIAGMRSFDKLKKTDTRR